MRLGLLLGLLTASVSHATTGGARAPQPGPPPGSFGLPVSADPWQLNVERLERAIEAERHRLAQQSPVVQDGVRASREKSELELAAQAAVTRVEEQLSTQQAELARSRTSLQQARGQFVRLFMGGQLPPDIAQLLALPPEQRARLFESPGTMRVGPFNRRLPSIAEMILEKYPLLRTQVKQLHDLEKQIATSETQIQATRASAQRESAALARLRQELDGLVQETVRSYEQARTSPDVDRRARERGAADTVREAPSSSASVTPVSGSPAGPPTLPQTLAQLGPVLRAAEERAQSVVLDSSLLLSNYEHLEAEVRDKGISIDQLKSAAEDALHETAIGAYMNDRISKAALKACDLASHCDAEGRWEAGFDVNREIDALLGPAVVPKRVPSAAPGTTVPPGAARLY